MYKINKHVIYLLMSLLIFQQVLHSEDSKKVQKSIELQKTAAGGPLYTRFNINKISTWIKNDGNSDRNPQTGKAGFTYPKGDNKQCAYQSGFMWGGRLDTTKYVGGSAYISGLVPGKIMPDGKPENPSSPNVRIYRVRPDYKIADFSSEIKDNEGTAQQIYDQYEKDWKEWPAQDGAPYKDVNGDGKYDPAVDIPGVPGADQTIWFVANDLNPTVTQNFYGSMPMGMEMQATIWGYNQDGALGNMMFRKYKLINKSGKTYKDMYVSMWSDIDVGEGSDDFVGCDTTLSLGYAYNANAFDETYKYIPPAVGFDFFQGPIVPGNSNDAAIFDGKRVNGKKNLGMSAFYFFINADQVYVDPTMGSYSTGTVEFYNLFQGKIGPSGQYFPIPGKLGGGETVFPLAGDPVTGKGWVDGIQHVPGDRRLGLSSGPFIMADKDTQEVVVAEIVAGAIQGVDRLGAIGLLKFYDLQAQNTYDNFFNVTPPPAAPIVTASEHDKEIILEWGDNLSRVNETESFDRDGFKFQGYNIYQFPSATASISEARRIATYDIKDGIGKIEGLKFDPNFGVVLKTIMQFGTDDGIKRYISVDKDAFKSNLPLNNGSRYYFAVTAYSYNPNPDAIPNTRETPPQILTLVPQSLIPGERLPGRYGDTLSTNEENLTNLLVAPCVVDPRGMNGHTYKVTLDSTDDELNWTLTDVTANKVLLANQKNVSGNDNYMVTDGFVLKVAKLENAGVKKIKVLSGKMKWTPEGGASGLKAEGLGGAIGNAPDNWLGYSTVDKLELKNTLIKFAATDNKGNLANPSDPNVSYAYRYMRKASDAAAKPEFAQHIKNKNGSGYLYQDYVKNFPFAAYEVEGGKQRRLMVGYLENNTAGGSVDGKYFPPEDTKDNYATSGPREWFFIFDKEYSETPDPSLMVDILNTEVPMSWVGSPARLPSSVFEAGDELMINPYHVFKVSDSYTFSTPKVEIDNNLAKEDINNINVFPNPYYGVNPQEINKYQRFVTFSHLPKSAKIKIFNLAGKLVRTIEHDSNSQFERWDLSNDESLPVGSGLYIAHIDMPGLGTKILKVAVIQEQQVLDRF